MEQALIFQVSGEDLLGILHPGKPWASRGVLIVVGGPQYRVGSHRQFLLLARYLATHGIPVFRFDYRGMGDSGGSQRDFEAVDEDIRAAIDVFLARTAGLSEVVIWGLCDAASAALLYAFRDPRVSGLVLLNPWVRTEEGLAKAYLKHYYLQRLISCDFWSGVLRGRLDLMASIRSLLGMITKVTGSRRVPPSTEGIAAPVSGQPYPVGMAEGWKRFQGPILLIFSGDDLTAAEFRDTAVSSPAWQGLLDQPRVRLCELPGANHTFSRREWRDQVAQWTLDWIQK